MRRTTLAAGLLLAAALTGCAKGGGEEPSVATAQSAGATPSASASTSAADDPDAPLKLSKCMREQGMTWFPDPVNGRLQIKVPANVRREDFEAAQKACRQWAPDDGDDGPKISQADLEKLRQMAKCMRDSGVPEFPDPQSDGGIHIERDSGIDPESPTFKAAEEKCSQYLPEGRTEKNKNGSGADGA